MSFNIQKVESDNLCNDSSSVYISRFDVHECVICVFIIYAN